MITNEVNATQTALTFFVWVVLNTDGFVEYPDSACRFTSNAAGVLTYTGLPDAIVSYSARMRVEVVSGTNQDLQFRVAVNGTRIDESILAIRLNSGTLDNMILMWNQKLSTGDTLQMWVRNVTSGNNIIADQIQIIAR